MLRQLIGTLPIVSDERILVGLQNAEDAVVYRLDAERALVATIDVITPLVDDPRAFGVIAATNAISDIYAMGGEPFLSLSFLGAPGTLPPETLTAILNGGADQAIAAGAPILGGHTIQTKDLVFGMAVIGMAHPDQIFTNDALIPGDELVLTKPLGTGTLTSAVMRDKLALADIAEAVAGMQRLNDVVPILRSHGVRAVTDITGFGLLGHAVEMAEASSVRLVIEMAAVPALPLAREMMAEGVITGANKRNREYLEELGPVTGEPEPLLLDPQTSGGLLIAVRPERRDGMLAALHQAGFPHATRIGEVQDGTGIEVR